MVEKIIINPTKVRGYGNIVSSKGASDFITYAGSITEGTDTVYGATEKVYSLEDTFLFSDGGVTNNNSSSRWYRGSYGSYTVQDNGTKLLNTSNNNSFYSCSAVPSDLEVSSANTTKYNEPLTLEFDVVSLSESTNNDIQFQMYSGDSGVNLWIGLTSTGHYKLVAKNGSQKVYVDDSLIYESTYSLPNARITFRIRNGHNIVYKNFVIYSI